MIISKQTLDILKTFSKLNQQIYIKAGNELKIQTEYRDILAVAKLEDTFPKTFSISNLSRFIGVLSLFENSDIKFDNTFLTVNSGISSIRYAYAQDNLILKKPPENTPAWPIVVSMPLPQSKLVEITKSAAILGSADFIVEVSPGKIRCRVCNKKELSSDNYVIETDSDYDGNPYHFDVNLDKLRLIKEGDYDLMIGYKMNEAKKKIPALIFPNKNIELTYWMATEDTSSTID